MELIRYVNEEEIKVLEADGRVSPKRSFRAWDGRNRLYAFPRGYYTDQDYQDVADVMQKSYSVNYTHKLIIDTGAEEYITFAAYDKELADEALGREMVFDIDENAYDSGPSYIVPEVRLTRYELSQVKEIIKL